MPKPNQTMLDKLAETFKSMGNKKPEIIQATTIRDPLGYSMVQRRFGTATGKMPSMAPERQIYQRGLNNRDIRALRPLYEKNDEYEGELEDLQSEFNDAFEEAKKNYMSQIQDNMESLRAPDIREPFDPSYDLDPNVSSETLEPYWPDYDYNSIDYYSSRGEELGDLMDEYQGRIDYINSPEHRMELQRQSPRYRNYQRAMRQRQENAQMGRLNAAIMNLYRRGYSMPEIREILRNQRVR